MAAGPRNSGSEAMPPPAGRSTVIGLRGWVNRGESGWFGFARTAPTSATRSWAAITWPMEKG